MLEMLQANLNDCHQEKTSDSAENDHSLFKLSTFCNKCTFVFLSNLNVDEVMNKKVKKENSN